MLHWLLALVFCLMPFGASTAEVAVPHLERRVTDLTGTLSAEHAATLEARLAALEQSKRTQIAILIVATTQPETIEQYAIRVVDAWKLGRKGVDDGVLVLLAKEDRKSRIEVGYGLEGVLTDATAKRITTDTMRPYFRQGDFYGGLTAGVNAIASVVHGGPLPDVKPKPKPSNDSPLEPGVVTDVLLVAALIIGLLVHVAFGDFMGAAATGSLIGLAVFVRGAEAWTAVILGLFLFLLMLFDVPWVSVGHGRSDDSGGNSGFSGGGGSFGGGGASGDW